MGSYDQTTLKKVVNKPTDKLAHVEIAREKSDMCHTVCAIYDNNICYSANFFLTLHTKYYQF